MNAAMPRACSHSATWIPSWSQAKKCHAPPGAMITAVVGETPTPMSDESLFEKLAVPGAVQLLEAFASVQQPSMRTAILNLTRSLIEDSEETVGIRRAR